MKYNKLFYFVIFFLLFNIHVYAQSCESDDNCGLAQCDSGNVYRNAICLESKCVPLLFSEKPCGEEYEGADGKLIIAAASPRFGVSTEDTFDIVIWTSRTAKCKYSTFLEKDYKNMLEFEITNSKIHDKSKYSPTFQKTPFYVKCNDTTLLEEVFSAMFELLKDNTAPVLKARASPDIIADPPLSTALVVVSDDKVVCKYDAEKNKYDEMANFFSGDDENDANSYSFEKSHTLNNLVDETNYLINVSCKNLAGIVSLTHPINFVVNTKIKGTIINITPADGISLSSTSVFFEVYTSKNSICWYGNTTDPIDHKQTGTFGNDDANDEGRAHKSNTLTLREGKDTYKVKCCFNQCQEEALITTTFTIDTTPPSIPEVDDSTNLEDPEYTYSLTSLSAEWSSEDNESDVVLYNYSIYEGTSLFVNWTTTTETSITVEDLKLSNSKIYYFHVKAKNGVGNWSNIGKSNGVKVDITKAPISCANNILDGTETDVDCGGNCSLCREGKKCKEDSDCRSNYCSLGNCTIATCSDGVQNQRETGIDCGGPCSRKCKLGQGCIVDSNCESGLECISRICSEAEPEIKPEVRPLPVTTPEPEEKDSDEDGLLDEWELKYSLDPFDPLDAEMDSDGDGLTNLQEYAYGTNPNKADSDNDKFSDKEEIEIGTDPLDAVSKPGGIGGLLIFVVVLIIILGAGSYVFYYHKDFFIKPKAQPSFIPAYMPKIQPPEKPILRKELEKERIEELVKERRGKKEEKREKLFEAFGKKKVEEEAKPLISVDKEKHKIEKMAPEKLTKEEVFTKLKLISKKEKEKRKLE